MKGDGTIMTTTYYCHPKSIDYGNMVAKSIDCGNRVTKLSFCSGYDVQFFFPNLQKRSFTYFTCRECGILQTRCPLWFTVRFSAC